MGATDSLLREAIDKLSGLPEALRQTLTDHQWSTIPLYIDEYAFAQALAAGSPLDVSAQTSGLEEVTSIVAVVPAGATSAIVQLGLMQIPVSVGTTVIAPVQKVLGTSDIRRLTFNGGAGGPAFLWLTGQQLPTYGVLAP